MPAAPVAKKASKVLIVEDDPAISHACVVLLQHYEFSTAASQTLAQARSCLASEPDLVILDLSLPDGDGIGLLDLIRRSQPKIKVFILTGDGKPDTQQRVMRHKPDRFFLKPLNFIAILQAVRECLNDEHC